MIKIIPFIILYASVVRSSNEAKLTTSDIIAACNLGNINNYCLGRASPDRNYQLLRH